MSMYLYVRPAIRGIIHSAGCSMVFDYDANREYCVFGESKKEIDEQFICDLAENNEYGRIEQYILELIDKVKEV